MLSRAGLLAAICLFDPLAVLAEPPPAAPRRVSPDEIWQIRDGRFHRNGEWVFLKTGKLLRDFRQDDAAAEVIADIDIMVSRLHYNAFSLNIYPDQFDADADGRIDPERERAHAGIGRILDHCWQIGVFCALSFETYNVGGGGTPKVLFTRHPDIVAINALGEPARDVEYGGPSGKPIPSVFHPEYRAWSHRFIQAFLTGLGKHRLERLLYVETTVEPQYLGRCSYGDRDLRRAFLDFSPAARDAFDQWQASFPEDDPRRTELRWPGNQGEREALRGHALFNEFRGRALGEWVTSDIQAIRSVAPEMYVAVDYNGRFDDPHGLRLGDREAFLRAIEGADIIQIAPHAPEPWGDSSWNDVIRVNGKEGRNWAITEHMTAAGEWSVDDARMIKVLENTLARGTRWGWEFVNAGNRRASDSFHLYNADWTSSILNVIEGENWPAWLRKIGASPFVPAPRPR